MVIVIVSDCPAKATKIRQALGQKGYECPTSRILSSEGALEQVGQKKLQPDLMLVAIAQKREQTVDLLRQLRSATAACILVIGPRDANLILDTVRAGANDFIDEKGDLGNELATAWGRVAESNQSRVQQGQLVTVCGASGGSGRTFLATNLAVSTGNTSSRCCLIDLDLQGGDAAPSLNLKPRHSVSDLCYNIDKFDQKMFEQSLLEYSQSLSILAAPERWFDAERLSADAVQKLLRVSRSSFPQVVVDLNCFWLPEYAELLQQSAAILFMLRLDFSSVRNARRALSQLERMGVDKNKIQIVAGFHGQPKEIDEAKVESALDMKVKHRIPYDPKTANLCINCGTPAVIESPGSPLAKSIADIGHFLNGTTAAPTTGVEAALDATWQQSVARIRNLLEDKARVWRTALPASRFRPHNS